MCIYIYIYTKTYIYIYIYIYIYCLTIQVSNALPDPGALNSCMHACPGQMLDLLRFNT